MFPRHLTLEPLDVVALLTVDESVQIAQHVYDTVAHAMAAINVQAGVAAHLVAGHPERATDALRDIKAAPGLTMTDLRATEQVVGTALQALDAPNTPSRVISGRLNKLSFTLGELLPLPRRVKLTVAASALAATQ